MKKTVLIISVCLTAVIGSYFVYRTLPLTISRSSDIKLGEEIINNIESYRQTDGLPDNNDWETLRRFGFRTKRIFCNLNTTDLTKKHLS